MNCDDIKKFIKPFLDDMLSESEYAAFSAHLAGCRRCRDYVRSIGSVSNQLFRLGDIKVASDFDQTVLFVLQHPEHKPSRPRLSFLKRRAVRLVGALVVLLVFFGGIYYFKIRSRPETIRPASKGVVPQVQETAPLKPTPVPVSFDEPEAIPIVITPQEESVGVAQSESKVEDSRPVAEHEPAQAEAGTLRLHWHFLCSQDSTKAEFLTVLANSGMRIENRTDNPIFFTAQGQRIEEALSSIILMSQEASQLHDFTSDVPIFSDKTYDVSVYFDKRSSLGLHWHIGFSLAYQKDQLLDIISQRGGVIDYRSQDLITFSIARTEVDKLKARILAMRPAFSEFGRIEKTDQLISKPVKISIYFSP